MTDGTAEARRADPRIGNDNSAADNLRDPHNYGQRYLSALASAPLLDKGRTYALLERAHLRTWNAIDVLVRHAGGHYVRTAERVLERVYSSIRDRRKGSGAAGARPVVPGAGARTYADNGRRAYGEPEGGFGNYGADAAGNGRHRRNGKRRAAGTRGDGLESRQWGEADLTGAIPGHDRVMRYKNWKLVRLEEERPRFMRTQRERYARTQNPRWYFRIGIALQLHPFLAYAALHQAGQDLRQNIERLGDMLEDAPRNPLYYKLEGELKGRQAALSDIDAALESRREALDELFFHNVRLVMKEAGRAKGKIPSFEVPALVDALYPKWANAIMKFDMDGNCTLSTYMTPWLRQHMRREGNREQSLYEGRHMSAMKRSRRPPGAREGVKPNEMGYPVFVSLNARVRTRGDTDAERWTLLEGNGEDPAAEVERRDAARRVYESARRALTPLEVTALELRHGFEEGREYTLHEIAAELHRRGLTPAVRTRERVRQIVANAERKVRLHSNKV